MPKVLGFEFLNQFILRQFKNLIAIDNSWLGKVWIFGRVDENEGFGRHLGASFVTRVRSGESTLRLLLDLNARVGGDTSRWQALLNLVVHPFGRGFPLYAGMGTGLSKRGSVEVGDGRESLAGHHTILAGLDFAAAFVRPFVQVYVLDPLAPSRVAISSSLGVRFQLGS